MKANLVRIGNSRGIRIPRPLIEQCGLGRTVELRMEDGRLVISAHRGLREGWDAAFSAAQSSRRAPLLLSSLPQNRFDRQEWNW